MERAPVLRGRRILCILEGAVALSFCGLGIVSCRLPPFDLATSLSLIGEDSTTKDDGIPPGGKLVAWWDFTTTPVPDSSGNGIPLIVSAGTPQIFLGSPNFLRFTSINDRLQTSHPDLDNITNGQSVSFWYLENGFPQSAVVSRYDSSSTRVWTVGPQLAGNFNVMDGGSYLGGGVIDFGPFFGGVGVWNHVVVAFDVAADQARVYINNVQRAATGPLTGNYSATGSIFVGNNPDGSNAGRAPNGEDIGDVRIYNYALTAEHVNVLFVAGP